MGIIALLLAALIPVVGLTKSSGRKGAVSNLLGALEQARTLAIKDGRNTYVAFVTSGVPAALAKDYEYRAYAIFEDDPTGTTQVQVTNWSKLPTGISFRASNSAPVTSITTSNGYPIPLPFSPAGATAKASCHCIEFGSSGEVENPSGTPLVLSVFEGLVENGTELVTSAKNSSGEPAASESISIARLTGRAERQ